MTNIFRKRLAFLAQNIYLYRPNNSINHTTMMKQALLPACAALLLLAGSAQAQSVTIEGIEYTVDSDGQTAAVTNAEQDIKTANVLATVDIDGMDYAVTAIGEQAFYDCDALQSITLPEGVQTIGAEAFIACTLLESVTFPKRLQIISHNAFTYCHALQSVTLPEGLQSIGSTAFAFCKSLQCITLPEGIQSISDGTFAYCESLESITLPEGLQTIGSEAFLACPLKDITCLSMNPPTFYSNTFDENIYNNATLHVPTEAWAAYQANSYWEPLIRYPNIDGVQYHIDFATQEASVTGADTGITSAAIPAAVEHEGTSYPAIAISDYAFQNCTALQSIILPERLQNIGNYAFKNCAALQSINIPQGITKIGEQTFYSCAALQSITLPEGLQAIGNYTFYECTALENVILPEELTSIGNNAFYGCPLKDITCLATTPPAIGYNTFDSDTYANAALHVPAEAWATYQANADWEHLIRYPNADGIQYYIDFATQEASITGADKSITTTNIPVTIEYERMDYPVNVIGNQAFYKCELLQSITLPKGLKSIGGHAFQGCTALESVSFPKGLQSIGYYAFQGCTTLESITFLQGLQSIGYYAFQGCTALESVSLPEGLQTIDFCTFWGCPLTDIYCHAAIPPAIDEDAFSEDTYTTATLHVPSDAVGSYQAAEGWKLFQHIVGDLPSTAISSVAADASLATYAGGILTTESPAAITVYAQNGAQALHTSAATSLSLAGLPGGIYIICIDMEGQRQVMKVAR